MVVEVAGGKKQEGEKDLPGYTEIALTPVEEAAVPVVGGRKRKHSCCFFYLLLVCALLGTSIYFGVMSQRYKKHLNVMEQKCKAMDGLPMPNRDDGPDDKPHWPHWLQKPQKPNRPHRPGGRPHGDHDNDDVFDKIVDIIRECVRVDEIKVKLENGEEIDWEDIVLMDKDCLQDEWSEVMNAFKGL